MVLSINLVEKNVSMIHARYKVPSKYWDYQTYSIGGNGNKQHKDKGGGYLELTQTHALPVSQTTAKQRV